MNLNLRWSRRRHLHETASPRRRLHDHTRVYACRERTFRSPQGQLASALVRPFKIDQEPLDARLLASTVGVDHNAAPDTIGYSTRDLTHGLDLSKMLIETLHGTMNVSKHFFLALYAVFLSLDLSKGLLGVLRKHGVDFFLKKKSSDNKTESCSIGNGVHWAKLYDQGFWADVAAVLREGGRLCESAIVRYVGTLVARFCALCLSHKTKAEHWLDLELLAVAMGTALRMCFYDSVISPAVFEMIRVLPQQLRRVHAMERDMGHVGASGLFSIVDFFYNGPFEYVNYALSQILRRSSRGGGRSKLSVEALGKMLAAKRSDWGSSLGAQYENLSRALQQHHTKAALCFILDLENEVEQRRIKRRAAKILKRYGSLPVQGHLSHPKAIATPHKYLLDKDGVEAPPIEPPVRATGARAQEPAAEGAPPPEKRIRREGTAPETGPAAPATAEPAPEPMDEEDDGSDGESDGAVSEDDEGAAAPPLDEDEEDLYADAALGVAEAEPELTLASASADVAAEGPRQTIGSGKLDASLVCSGTTLKLDNKFASKVLVGPTGTFARIVVRLAGEEVGTQIVMPFSRIAKVYYDKDSSTLSFLLSKPATFWRQHAHETKTVADDAGTTVVTTYTWRKTPTSDPSADQTISLAKLLSVESVTEGSFDKIITHLKQLPTDYGPECFDTAAPDAHLASKFEAAEALADAEDAAVADPVAGDFGPQNGIANLRAFPRETLEALGHLDQAFYEAAHGREARVPDPFDDAAADAYLKAYLARLSVVQKTFFDIIQKKRPAVYGLNELDA